MARVSLFGWLLLRILTSATQVASPIESQQTSSFSESQSHSQKAKSILGEGLQYLNQARYEQAIEAFRKSLDLDPTLVIAQYDLGVAYFSLNRFDECRKSLETVLRQNPEQIGRAHV